MRARMTFGALALALTAVVARPADAQHAATTEPADAVLAADHALEVSAGHVHASTAWALRRPLADGEVVPLARPLPATAELESASFAAVARGGEITALRARRHLPAGIHTLEVSAPSADAGASLAMPRSSAVNRVRLSRALRFWPREGSGLRHRLGIVVADDIPHAERQRADRALDGARAHRRLGAVYVRGVHPTLEPAGLDGTLETTASRHGRVLGWVLAVALALLGGLALVYRRLCRAVDRERVDAYLERELGRDLMG